MRCDRLIGELLALWRQLHQHPTAIRRIRQSLRKSGATMRSIRLVIAPEVSSDSWHRDVGVSAYGDPLRRRVTNILKLSQVRPNGKSHSSIRRSSSVFSRDSRPTMPNAAASKSGRSRCQSSSIVSIESRNLGVFKTLLATSENRPAC